MNPIPKVPRRRTLRFSIGGVLSRSFDLLLRNLGSILLLGIAVLVPSMLLSVLLVAVTSWFSEALVGEEGSGVAVLVVLVVL